jgi:hypothetical protein
MKFIDMEYENEYKDIGYTKEEVMNTFCPTDKAILGNIPCRKNINKNNCLNCWNRENC